MPYIKQERRKEFKDFREQKNAFIRNSGELNYLITTLLLEYLNNHETSYQTYNDIIGALEGAKLELYRRQIAPYEDQKKKENGEVY